MARKFLAEEDFTFEDFLQQMSAIKMGSLKSMLKMMPGMQQMRASSTPSTTASSTGSRRWSAR